MGDIQDYDELEDEIEIRYPENYDVRTDIERREGFKMINENITGSPTLLSENATQYYTQVIAVSKDVQTVIDKELEDHYNQVTKGTLEEEVSGIGAENIRPFVSEQVEVDETINEETL